jgi:hypothetical protein
MKTAISRIKQNAVTIKRAGDLPQSFLIMIAA